MGRSSATALLALQKAPYLDPAYTAIGRPVLEWAVRVNKAYYENDKVTLAKHHDAWEAHKGVMLMANHKNEDMWKHVCGPATGVMASLCGINWIPRAYYQWEIDIGETVNIRDMIPYLVKRFLYKSITRQLWATSDMAKADDQKIGSFELDRPFWPPARKVIFGPNKEFGSEKSCGCGVCGCRGHHLQSL